MCFRGVGFRLSLQVSLCSLLHAPLRAGKRRDEDFFATGLRRATISYGLGTAPSHLQSEN